MCIAVVQKPGAVIDDASLYRGWTINNDGGGFAYVDDNDNVVIEKGFMEYNPFQKKLRAAIERFGKTSPFLIHMRIRTSGKTDDKNCHPFKIKGGAMIHNGVLFTPTQEMNGNKKLTKSDTRIFAESFHNILHLEDVKKAGDDILFAFGRSNKLAFLYENREVVILNEKAGYWDKDIWYSNHSCKAYSRAY